MIQQAAQPIYAVSAGMRVVFCNQALCDATGFDDEFLTSLTCVYQTASDQPPSKRLATGLCPPPDAFSGHPSQGWITLLTENHAELRPATFIPTGANEALSNLENGVIVFVHEAQPDNQPPPLGREESPDNRHLHTAISQMQLATASSINIDRLVGISPAAQRIRKQVEVAGKTGANVAIIGPPGSGRHNIATLIHFANGPELAGPMIPIRCPLSNMETVQETIKELYRSHKQFPDEPLGRLFLRDVDQLPEQAQAELLGFLQLPDFQLSLIATASPQVENRLRPELWQHLSTLTIELPRLMERREDIPYLAHAIVEQFNDANRAQLAGIDSETQSLLTRYDWPGELNELVEAIDIACRETTAVQIRLQDLPQHLRIALRFLDQEPAADKTTIDLDNFLAEIEEQLIRRAVAHTGGNKSEAARLLGISRPRLLRRLASETELPDFTELDSDTAEETP